MSTHRSALGVASDGEDDSDDVQLRARQLLSASPSTSVSSSLSSSASFIHSPSASSPSPDACDEQKVTEMLEELVLTDDLDDARSQQRPRHAASSSITGAWRVPLPSSTSASPSPSSCSPALTPTISAVLAVSSSQSFPTSPSSSASSHSSSIRLAYDEFVCSICHELLCDPLTLPCQHIFCRHCLVACFELATKRCPQCRAPTADTFPSAETLGANTLLVRLLREAWGERYKEREDSVAEVRAGWKRKFPVYLSHELLFPYQTVLLNLHEPRYDQVMLKRLSSAKPADGKRRFAILPRNATSEGSVGVLCELVAETERHRGVGAFHVVTTQRFTVESLWQEDGTHGLHYARVHVLEDADESTVAGPVDALVQQSVERIHSAIQLYNSVCPFPLTFHSRFGSVPVSPHQLSFWLFQSLAVDTAAVSVERGLVSSMLESRSLLWRLGVGEELMQQLVSRALAEHDMLQQSVPQPDISLQQLQRQQYTMQQPHAAVDVRGVGARVRAGQIYAERGEAEREMLAFRRIAAAQSFPLSPASPGEVSLSPQPPILELSPQLAPQSPQLQPQQPVARHPQRQHYRGHQQHNRGNRRYPRPFVYGQQQQSPPLQGRPNMSPAHFPALSHEQQHFEQAYAASQGTAQRQFGGGYTQQLGYGRHGAEEPSEAWSVWQSPVGSQQSEQRGRAGQGGQQSAVQRQYSLF